MKNYLGKRHKNMGPVSTNIFWKGDKESPHLMTTCLELDHDINGDELCKAYEETLSVWPLLKDAFVVQEDGNIYFVENKRPVRVHYTKEVVAAGTRMNDDRVIAVSYYEKTVTFTGMHSFLDGGSLFMVMKGTLCRYLQLHYKKTMEVGLLPKPGEGDKKENYEFYVMRSDIASLPYERKETIWATPVCFQDPRMKKPKEALLSLSRIEINKEEFMSYCKQNSANPSIMLFMLIAKAIFKANPENELPFSSLITMNIRSTLGIDMAIMGQSSALMLDVSKEELVTIPFAELIKQKRFLMNQQRSKDYLLSRAEDMRNGKGFFRHDFTVRLSYFGEFDYGECTQYVRDILTYNETYDEVHMFALNGSFYIDLLFGEASEEYAGLIVDILKEEGVFAKVCESFHGLPTVVRACAQDVMV